MIRFIKINLSKFFKILFCIYVLCFCLPKILASSLNSDVFYERGKVQEIRLQISSLNLKKMNEALPERKYVSASLIWRDIKIENIGVRYKGNSSSQPNQKHKRGYLINVKKFNKDNRFLKLRRIALDNGVQFGSLFSEPIVTDILKCFFSKKNTKFRVNVVNKCYHVFQKDPKICVIDRHMNFSILK